MAKRYFVTIQAGSFADLNDLIQGYLKKHYTVTKIWFRRRWLPWLYTYYAKLELKRSLVFSIGPVSTRELPQKPVATTLSFKIGPITQREVRR